MTIKLEYLNILCNFTQNFFVLKHYLYFCTRNFGNNMNLNRIKEVLDEKGITQTWLAKQLDKSFNSVNAYVCNRSQPNLETLAQIAKCLNVKVADLIKEPYE